MRGVLLPRAAVLCFALITGTAASWPAALWAQQPTGTAATAALPNGHYEGDGHDHDHHKGEHSHAEGHDHAEHDDDEEEGAEPRRNAALLSTMRGDTMGLAAGLAAAGFGAWMICR